MANDELTGNDSTVPRNHPPAPPVGKGTQRTEAGASSMPPVQDLPPAQDLPPTPDVPPQPGFVPTGYAPSGYAPPQPGFGPPGYAPPATGFGPPPYPIQPRFGPPDFGPAPYPASGWLPAQSGRWDWAPYPPTGWGFGPAWYVPPGPGPGLLWGGVGIRFAALLIDMVVVVGGLFAVSMVMSAFDLASASGRSDSFGAAALALAAWLFILIYHPACWYIFGATAGKRVLGLRVVRAYDGRELGISAVLVRYAIFLVVTVLFPLGIVSAYMTANDPFKRAWHDDVSRSIVVRRP